MRIFCGTCGKSVGNLGEKKWIWNENKKPNPFCVATFLFHCSADYTLDCFIILFGVMELPFYDCMKFGRSNATFIKIQLDDGDRRTVPIKSRAHGFCTAANRHNDTRIINVTHNKTENVSDATMLKYSVHIPPFKLVQNALTLSLSLMLFNFNHF